MTPSSNTDATEWFHHWVVVRPEPPGGFTAQVVGLPELHASAASRELAVEQLRAVLQQWLACGQLAPVSVRAGASLASCHDPADPLEQEFLADLERFRQEDCERALRESPLESQPCSNISSTPST